MVTIISKNFFPNKIINYKRRGKYEIKLDGWKKI